MHSLPALVCFREGVVASKANHPQQLRQVIRAILTQTEMIGAIDAEDSPHLLPARSSS